VYGLSLDGSQGVKDVDDRLGQLAHFSDRGHPFHADRGHRFTLMADGVQRVRVTEFIVSQLSAMAVKPTVLSTPARSAGVGDSAPKAMVG
jgi:hypothetical protein